MRLCTVCTTNSTCRDMMVAVGVYYSMTICIAYVLYKSFVHTSMNDEKEQSTL